MDLGDIMHIAKDPMLLKEHLAHGSLVYVNDEYTALSIFNRINVYCLEAHVESLKEARGFKLKKFLVDSGKDAVTSMSEITSVLGFVDKNNKALQLFSATFAERVGVVGDTVLYVTERERYL